MELDHLDQIAAKAFEGFIVRKDLVRRFKGQYPVPTYVAEFLLGRYCASVNEAEIKEGLEIVQRQLESRTVRAGEEELFKAKAKNEGRVKLIDVIRAKLDTRNDRFQAELPSVRLNDVRIGEDLVRAHERMLTGGFYAEIDLSYDPTIAEEEGGRPFGIDTLREIQLSKRDSLETMAKGRALFTFEEWREFLLRSIGLEPSALSKRTQDVMLLRMVPFVENNYNAIELGPRGTGKSHLFQQVSPYAHLVSGGKATCNTGSSLRKICGSMRCAKLAAIDQGSTPRSRPRSSTSPRDTDTRLLGSISRSFSAKNRAKSMRCQCS